VPPAEWGCRPHWYALPLELRSKIWAAYVPGQEVEGTPSAAYLAVADAVQVWIAQKLAGDAAKAASQPQQGSLFG
jgi:hypothetical protein